MRFTSTLLLIIAFASCSKKKSNDPFDYVDRKRQEQIIQKFVRYAVKLPPASSRSTMFDPEFNEYYERAARELNLVYLNEQPGGGYYFLFSRPARSINPMYEGVGGWLQLNDKDSLVEYEEVFRTWKMEEKDLRSRGKFLFERMKKGEDLTPFYSKLAGDKYIEFPDDRYHFDKNERKWIDVSGDTILNEK